MRCQLYLLISERRSLFRTWSQIEGVPAFVSQKRFMDLSTMPVELLTVLNRQTLWLFEVLALDELGCKRYIQCLALYWNLQKCNHANVTSERFYRALQRMWPFWVVFGLKVEKNPWNAPYSTLYRRHIALFECKAFRTPLYRSTLNALSSRLRWHWRHRISKHNSTVYCQRHKGFIWSILLNLHIWTELLRKDDYDASAID